MISPNTVHTHLRNLSDKLDVHGRRALVAQAQAFGLLD
jgi:DNA-binding CsgD family transcriptional regulator